VGVQSEPLNGAIGSLQIKTTVGSMVRSNEDIALSGLPHEVRLVAGPGEANSVVAVQVDGYTQLPGSTAGASPILVRTAETHFAPGRTMLLRVMLQGQCLLPLPGGPPGAPVCTAPQTCIDGICQNDLVAVQGLENYAPNWPANAPDVCKPLNAGAPIVQVGTGQTDYLPVTSGQTIQMEQGPQGGHHVWVAVRQENLKQSGSTTTITSVQPGTGLVGPKTSFVFTFEPDQGGFCKLYGLRYQVDVGGLDYHLFLGKPLDITVTIADQSGETGSGVAHVMIDPSLLCPSGVPGC
jgi:hypothetical protein